MKLFQQLLVAPAALGLMAPLAVNAAELNIDGVSDYNGAAVEAQTFADVHPSDWAFKALSELAERHGCAVATPNNSMSRYEAAALLNKCLSDVAQVSEEEQLLLAEFGPEIAVLKGRVDGLEARIGEFEAGQFSSTTQMKGKAAFNLGFVDKTKHGSGETKNDSIFMNYVYQLDMNSSFSGEDLLYARIKTGNFGSDHFATKSSATYMSAANSGASIGGTKTADVLYVDKIWYQFPVGDNFKFWVGPKIENYYMLASAPSIYKPIMKQFALGGNGTVYGSSTQAGVGAAWTQDVEEVDSGRFAISLAYTNKGGEESAKDHGLFGDGDASKILTKLEYGTPRWQASLAAAWTDSPDSASTGWEDDYYATSLGHFRSGGASETAVGLRGWWKPEEVGLIPEVSFGLDTSSIDGQASGKATETLGWMLGLGWKDLFVDGNKAGLAFGQRVHATELKGGGTDDADDNFTWEAYYTFQVSDNISVTPAVFGSKEPWEKSIDSAGGLVLTEFRF